MDVADQLIKVIDKLTEKFGIVVDTSKPVLEQISHKIINYQLYLHIMYLIVGILIFSILFISYYRYRKKLNIELQVREDKKCEFVTNCSELRDVNKEISEIKSEGSFVTSLIVIAGVITLVFTIRFSNEIAKCKLLPEQVVIEYVSDQYKKLK